MIRAHRFAYAAAHGPIADGLVIDHRCFVSACVNPDHLRAITTKQNGEHRSGPASNSKSGLRSVFWARREKKWKVAVVHHGKHYHGGYHRSIADAEAAAIALRARLFTHDDGYQA